MTRKVIHVHLGDVKGPVNVQQFVARLAKELSISEQAARELLSDAEEQLEQDGEQVTAQEVYATARDMGRRSPRRDARVIHMHLGDARPVSGDLQRMAREAVQAGKSESQFRSMLRDVPVDDPVDFRAALEAYATARSNKEGQRYVLKDGPAAKREAWVVRSLKEDFAAGKISLAQANATLREYDVQGTFTESRANEKQLVFTGKLRDARQTFTSEQTWNNAVLTHYARRASGSEDDYARWATLGGATVASWSKRTNTGWVELPDTARDAEGEVANDKQLIESLKRDFAAGKITVARANATLREYEVQGTFTESRINEKQLVFTGKIRE